MKKHKSLQYNYPKWILISIVILIVIFVFIVVMQNRVRKIQETSILPSKLWVDSREIISGGPPRDGIPSLNNPHFIALENVDFLSDNSPGIAVKADEDIRFYPFAILVWHEIVNDIFGKKPLAITYCPLCESSIVFEREIDGTLYDFGTSGKLYQSNLVMYDRQTNSLWSQILEGAISGPLKGTFLKVYPSSLLTFGELKQLYPDAKVLSTETGYERNYAKNPYGNYAFSNEIYFPVAHKDQRLNAKTLVYAFSIDEKFKAYDYLKLIERGEFRDTLAGHDVIITVGEDKEIIVQDLTVDKRVYGFTSFWFAWATHHPDAELWTG